MIAISEQTFLDEMVEFVTDHYPGYYRLESEIRKILVQHYYYNTLDYLVDERGIFALMRFNVSKSGEIADVLDLIIHNDKKKIGLTIIKSIIARNWAKFPKLKYFRFVREDKYPGRLPRIYKLSDLFQGRR